MRHKIAQSMMVVCLASGVMCASVLPAQAATTVGGTVQCASGAEVVGVWVDASSSKDRWAKTTSTGLASYKKFSVSLSKGGSYSVHVGCGWKNKYWWGGGKVWATNNKSRIVKGKHSFMCYDLKTSIPRTLSDTAYQKCFG